MIINMQLDARQKEIAQLFTEIASAFKPQSFIGSLKKLFVKPGHSAGIYLHGSVGRGKTMLMQKFYDQVTVSKEIIHFQKFMRMVHEKMHHLQKASADRVVQDLALEIASRASVVCMDEFEIKDISDAMIIQRLFRHLSKHGVFIFLTTNTLPDNLYKDGLQRESFMPFIAMVKKNFTILHLDTEKDYRFDSVAKIEERVLFPASSKTKIQLEKIKHDLCDEEELSPAVVKLFGRKIEFQSAHQNSLFTNFTELFRRDFGYADYVAICEKFQIIVLEDVQAISEDETDIITRFINFIDNAYFYRVLLFTELAVPPPQIYPKGKRTDEFVRTISRLNEMNMQDYLKKKD